MLNFILHLRPNLTKYAAFSIFLEFFNSTFPIKREQFMLALLWKESLKSMKTTRDEENNKIFMILTTKIDQTFDLLRNSFDGGCIDLGEVGWKEVIRTWLLLRVGESCLTPVKKKKKPLPTLENVCWELWPLRIQVDIFLAKSLAGIKTA